jgi:predicted deacylase
MTALMHGVEVIGAMALLDLIEKLAGDSEPLRRLRTDAHLVVLPVVNPDAFFKNMDKVGRGERAWQRCNANGVDLNRNFPRLTTKRLYHPFSGSRFKMSPHYLGPHSLSEPESRAVARVAHETRPILSLAFHSFGNLALYPWAYTDRENERAADYQKLAAALNGALSKPYGVHQARQLYSVLGDMDDWLDAELGTLAFTIEVGRPDVRWRDGRHLTNPFRWMNPAGVRETVDNLTPGIVALASSALGFRTPTVRPSSGRVALPLEFAAK